MNKVYVLFHREYAGSMTFMGVYSTVDLADAGRKILWVRDIEQYGAPGDYHIVATWMDNTDVS